MCPGSIHSEISDYNNEVPKDGAPKKDLGSMRASQRRSVYFSKDDQNMDMPSLPVAGLIEELKSRHGKTQYAMEFLAAVEEADRNGDGLISIPELVLVLEQMNTVKKENTKLHKYLCYATVLLLIFLLAIFGLLFGVIKLTQETSTGDSQGNTNALVNKDTGVIVDTHPSDGGGIFLHMGSFTEPVNITFPSFEDKSFQCVGQITEEQVADHFRQFTTGGSAMTIRYKDYSNVFQPLVFANIPASTIEVTGYETNPENVVMAASATDAVKHSMKLDGETRKRKLSEAKYGLQGIKAESQVGATGSVRRLMTCPAETQSVGACLTGGIEVCSGGFTACVAFFDATSMECGACPPATSPESSGAITARQGSTCVADDYSCLFGPSRGRFLQEEDAVATVADYMTGFASQNADITFIKDEELQEGVYYVCHASEATVF
ncbi:expressed unknown protein [Seminavis robusta]|uniref:EF-hand domain-containing protein n=1 Tax=Seminavis robusta TaxID=568900 RepID=A0A9N8ELS4_9STRA|nr:expressed unknown protein [Seminavis robusta]|eukprot:Sro1142_g245760.1 n/a (435) ;mRNA; f:7581-8954